MSADILFLLTDSLVYLDTNLHSPSNKKKNCRILTRKSAVSAVLEFMFWWGMCEGSDRGFESWRGYGLMSVFVCAAFFCLEAVMS